MLGASASIADQLARSSFLAGRTGTSPAVRLGLGELVNASNERLSDLDRRAMVTGVLLEPRTLELLGSKNVSVVLPPASASELERYGVAGAGGAASESAATHAVSAEFGSLTRAGAKGRFRPADARKDVFLVDLAITELSTRSAVWAGRAEFARAARGLLVD